jgi:hypothetical protein
VKNDTLKKNSHPPDLVTLRFARVAPTEATVIEGTYWRQLAPFNRELAMA